MAGGNYHAQLYNDYEEVLVDNERLLQTLKQQAKLVSQRAKELAQLEQTVVEQKRTHAKLEAKSNEQLAQIAALEKEVLRLNGLIQTDGSNSGIPTSQTPIQHKKRIPNTRQKSGKQKGGQLGREKKSLSKFNDQEVNGHDTHGIDCCPTCQGSLVDTGEKQTKDELDYKVIVIKKRHEFPEYRCTECGKKTRAAIPTQLKEQNQYGPHVQALALSLMNEANVSINKTKSMIEGMTFGELTPSEGYLAKLQKRGAKHLQPFVEELRRHLLKRSLVYWDDTVIMIDQKRCCLRFYGDERLALYKAHLHKDLEGIKSDHLLTLLGPETTVMHDHNRVNYNQLFSYDNIECNVHLLRDLRKCVDNTGHEWAGTLDRLMTTMNINRNQLIEMEESAFSNSKVMSFFADLDVCLVKGVEEYTRDIAHYYSPKERALIKRLTEYRSYYFAWVTNFDLPFTNNLSERSLRGVKSKMKVAGQFQHLETARYYATIKSYIETCYRHEINGIDALNRLMAGKPYTVGELLTSKQAQT